MPSYFPRFVVEYAKSDRSMCHYCREKIPFEAPRLAVVYREPNRRYLGKMWYHFHCPSHILPRTTNSIAFFHSLQRSDQEALTNYLKEHKASAGKRRKNDEAEAVRQPRNLIPAFNDIGEEVVFSINEVDQKYKDAVLPNGWKSFKTVIFNEQDGGVRGSDKIAAFDFEGCIANCSPRAVGADGWSLIYPSIPQKLKSLHDDGYKLVIFTNEPTVEFWKRKRQVAIDTRISRLDSFIKLVNLPIQVFVACQCGPNDVYWKPSIGMWTIMKSFFNSNVSIDVNSSFIVGNSFDDRTPICPGVLFAERIGLKLCFPKEIFC